MNTQIEASGNAVGVVRIDPETSYASYIAFGDAVRINTGGTIEINPNYSSTEAAVAFWQAVREIAPNMIGETASAIARLESLPGVGWYVGKGRETRSEPLYAVAIVDTDEQGVARGRDLGVVAEADTITAAVDRAIALRSKAPSVTHPANFLIWSNEHRAWWRPGRCGYCTSLASAGLYTRDDAMEIVTAATLYHDWKGWRPPNEICVCIDDLPEQARALVQNQLAEV